MNRTLIVIGVLLVVFLLIGFALLVPIALGLALSGGNSSDCSTPTDSNASNSSTTVGVKKGSKVYVVGDSISVGLAEGTGPLKKKLEDRGATVTVNGEVGRTVDQGVAAARQDGDKVDSADIIIVVLGTNPGGNVDLKSFESSVNSMAGAVGAGKNKNVYWVNVFSKGISQRADRNTAIENVAGSERDFRVIAADSKSIPTGSDNIHPTQEGYDKLAGVIDEAVSPRLGSNDNESSGSCSNSDASSGGAVSGNVQSLAKQLLDSKNVTYPLAGDRTRGVLQALADGKKAPTSCASQGVPSSTTVNPNMLKFLVDLSKNQKIGINALTDGCHSSSGSNHYDGNAVDFECPVDESVYSPVAKKYKGNNNGETCASTGTHSHYDFLK